jgi:CDP-glucose 4,6-dehydratase
MGNWPGRLGLPLMAKTTHGNWSGRRVLVTGATGLVGSWLSAELVSKGAEVLALVRSPDPASELYRSGTVSRLAVVSGALEDLATVQRVVVEHDPQYVFHIGAQAIVGVADRWPLDTFEANIRGTYNLLEACRLHGRSLKSVVVASSDKAYGAHDKLPYNEDLELKASRPYEVSKAAADMIARSYAGSYDMPVTVARFGNVYGGGDLNWSRIVPGTVRSLIAGDAPVVRSDGTFVRDYIHVRDVVDAYLILASADRSVTAGRAFNFSPERPVTVLEMVNVIRGLMGPSSLDPTILGEASDEIKSQYLSCDRAKRELGWSASRSLKDGLAETIEWYRAYLAAPGGSS